MTVWCSGGKISRQNRCILIAYKAMWHDASPIKHGYSSLDFSGRAPDRQSRAIVFSGVFTTDLPDDYPVTRTFMGYRARAFTLMTFS
ncbi:MAG: hypothetical protein ABRQ39_21425, partial [Candidatus Eremiobacterota bacterium]